MKSLPSFSARLFHCGLFLLFSCTILAQESNDYFTEDQQEKNEELSALLNSIQDKFYGQDFVGAIELSQKGRELSDSKKFYYYFTRISSNLGNALIKIGDTIQAVQIFEESLKKAEDFQSIDDTGNKKLESWKRDILITGNIDLANVLALTGDFKSAIVKYEKVLEITSDDDYYNLFTINYNIGESYLQLDKTELALPFIVESEKLSKITEGNTYKAVAELLLGKYYFQKGLYTTSISNFEKSIELGKSIDYIEAVIESNQYLSQAEAKLGNYQRAYEITEDLSLLKEEKFKADRVNAVQNATAKFKVDEIKRRTDAEIESEKFQAEIRRKEDLQRNTILWSSVALVISTALIVILFIGFSRRKRLNKDLTEKNIVYLEEKDKSEKLLTARNALFSRISHELRTPMYGIVGISNILIEDETIHSQQKKNIRSLKYSADYLLSLINNVLEMNKLNRTSNNTLVQEIFNLKELCYHAVESAKFISPDHVNSFIINIDENVRKNYKGDAVKLMQVLINLLGNSNKFTKSGTIELIVKGSTIDDKTETLEFNIIDNGKGISRNKLKGIFDETKLIERNDENEGTGLGLPISKKILELQDSNLKIESKEGLGTTVEFKLKLEIVPDTAHIIEDNYGLVKSESLKGKKILIVEDNKINQLVTKKIIEGYNGAFDIAESGLRAIDMVKKNHYNLILMDINMPPGMDGFEATYEIRKFNTSIPIIALTAVEQLEIEERMENSLMNDYLIKPFKSEEFLKKILHNLI